MHTMVGFGVGLPGHVCLGYAKVNSNICGECGYTELIAEDPAALYEAYLKAKSETLMGPARPQERPPHPRFDDTRCIEPAK